MVVRFERPARSNGGHGLYRVVLQTEVVGTRTSAIAKRIDQAIELVTRISDRIKRSPVVAVGVSIVIT